MCMYSGFNVAKQSAARRSHAKSLRNDDGKGVIYGAVTHLESRTTSVS